MGISGNHFALLMIRLSLTSLSAKNAKGAAAAAPSLFSLKGRVGTVVALGSIRLSVPYLDSIRPSGMALSSRAARAAGQLESSRSSALRR